MPAMVEEGEAYEGEIVKWVNRNLFKSGNGWGSKPTHAYIWTVEGLATSIVNKLSSERPKDTFEVIKVKLYLGGM